MNTISTALESAKQSGVVADKKSLEELKGNERAQVARVWWSQMKKNQNSKNNA